MSLVRAYRIPVEAYRAGTIESSHTVVAAYCGLEHGRVHTASSYEVSTDALPSIWIRSAAKPFQLVPLLMHPEGASILEDPRDIALCVASHEGTPQHADRVRALLQRHNLKQQTLQCGTHRPYFLQYLAASDPQHAHLYDELHNNCSGNHTAMMLWARACGAAPESYLDINGHPQQLIHHVLRAAAGCDPRIGVDNCGSPCYEMPLARVALAYLSLASRSQTEQWRDDHRENLKALGGFTDLVETLDRISVAMATQPRWVSGEATDATRLVDHFAGTLVIKHGAEGVLCVANRQMQGALALKVLDGNARALIPALLQLMQDLGWWDAASDRLFAELARPLLKGPPGHTVGELRVAAPHGGKSPVEDAPTPAL